MAAMSPVRVLVLSLFCASAACAPASEEPVAAPRGAADSAPPIDDGSTTPPGDGSTTMPSNVVDVRAEGAIGDGATDDSAVVQRALAKGVLLGRVVVFPAGRYRLASTVHADVGVGASLAIEGRDGATLVGATHHPVRPRSLELVDTSAWVR